MISRPDAALGLSVVAVILMTGSLSTHDIVMSQAGDGVWRVPHGDEIYADVPEADKQRIWAGNAVEFFKLA